MATHSSILAGIIPWTEEPGGLWSTVSQSQTQPERQCSIAHQIIGEKGKRKSRNTKQLIRSRTAFEVQYLGSTLIHKLCDFG